MSYLFGAIAAVVLINSVATIFLVRSSTFTGRQKTLQALLLWAVPVVGAFICLYFLMESNRPKVGHTSSEMGYTDSWLAGFDNQSEENRG
jgi:ABC-type maltose transport system permease subunit